MGGACSDPALQYHNASVQREVVKASVVPPMISSNGAAFVSTYGVVPGGATEIKSSTSQAFATETVVSTVPPPRAEEAIFIHRLANEDISTIATKSKVNLNIQQVDVNLAERNRVEQVEKYVESQAKLVKNEFTELSHKPIAEEVKSYVNPAGGAFLTPAISGSYINSAYGRVEPITAAATTTSVVVAPTASSINGAIPSQVVTASKIDMYGHKVWNDQEAANTVPNAINAGEVDIYGNLRRNFNVTH